jgi:ATP-dependent DNA helicase RecQ
LHELKTYGILKKQGTAYLNALARSLNNGGLIVTQMGEYPLVTLTPRGEQVMMGKTSYSLEWPSNDGGSKTSANRVDLKDLGFDGQLYDRLKDVRTRLAKAAQVPAYVIFSNDTLEHLARLRPKTMDAGLLVKGIGEAKAEKVSRALFEGDSPSGSGRVVLPVLLRLCPRRPLPVNRIIPLSEIIKGDELMKQDREW